MSDWDDYDDSQSLTDGWDWDAEEVRAEAMLDRAINLGPLTPEERQELKDWLDGRKVPF